MAKKTFFEKLTGASWDEGAVEEEVETEKETEKKEEKKEEKPKKEKPKKEQPAEEEPIGESEGQLTIDVYQNTNEVIIKSTIAGVEPTDLFTRERLPPLTQEPYRLALSRYEYQWLTLGEYGVNAT